MRETLTNKQSKLLKFVQDYTTHKGYSPSLKEMASHMGVRSLSTVHQHLSVLQSKGLLSKTTGRKRNIEPRNIPKLIRIPLLGTIAAGIPIEPSEDPEPVYVSTDIVKTATDHYALKVSGDSMIEDGIQDGDTVVVRAQNYVDNLGQTIVAIVDGGATLKRFGGITNDGLVKLIPRNRNMDVILADANSFEVRGRMVGLIRSVD